MKMIRRLVVMATFMFALVTVVAAQAAAPVSTAAQTAAPAATAAQTAAPTTSAVSSPAASPEDVQNLFRVLKIDKQMNITTTAIQRQLESMIPQLIEKVDGEQSLTPEEKDTIAQHLKTQVESIYSSMPIQQMLDNMVPVFQKHLSKSDIDGLSAFYSGPIGQRFLNEQPAMMQEELEANTPLLRKLTQDAIGRAKQEAQSLAEDIRKARQDKGKVDPVPEPATPKK